MFIYGGRDVRININDIKIINIYDANFHELRIDIYILCLMATVSKRAGKSKQLSAKRLGQRLWNSASFSLSHWIMAPFRLGDIVFTLVSCPYTQMDVDGLEHLLIKRTTSGSPPRKRHC